MAKEKKHPQKPVESYKTNIDVNTSTCKSTSNSNVKQTTLLLWLKKIFTIQTFSLLASIASVWIGYIAFFQNKPGELVFYNSDIRFNDNIKTIIYGFEQKNDSIIISDLQSLPSIANLTKHTIEDLTIIAYTKNNYDVIVNPRYNTATSEELSGNVTIADGFKPIGYKMYAYKKDKLFPNEPVLWPIYKIYTNKNEEVIYPIQLYYSYKSKDLTRLNLYLIGLPYSGKNKTETEKERCFINLMRPYLLECEKLDDVAIVYNSKIIQSLSESKIKKEDFNVSDISKLK